MTTGALRAIDRWVGVPLCALLTGVRRLRGTRPPAGPVRRILFVKLAEQGSTVLASDAVQSAIRRVGRENVFFVVFEENRFILDAMDLIPTANVIPFDAATFRRAVRSALAVVRRLRLVRADATIDLEFFSRSSAILAYLSGASRRVGLHRHAGEGPYRGDLLTHRLRYDPCLHARRLFRLLVEALDCDPSTLPACPPLAAAPPFPPVQYEPPPAEIAEVRAIVRARTGCSDVPPLVLLNPNGSDLLPLRRWEGPRYVELARRLLAARPDAWIAFTGRADEAAQAERLAAAVGSPRCLSLAGWTTVRQLLALYSLSAVLVTNDSGPAHFAALTPVEVVTLFGPETPALFAAETPRNRVLWARLACSPCVSALNNRVSRCRDNRCMQAISIDEVQEAALAAYDRAMAP